MPNHNIETLRHMNVFDVTDFDGRSVDLIGVGAVGSKVAMELAKLGISDLRVIDGDEVESHNIPNQKFGIEDVGESKAQAIAERIHRDTGLEPDVIDCYVDLEDTDIEFGNVVYLMVDSMEARREIFEQALEYNMDVGLVVEVRMGPDSWHVYSFNPNMPEQIEGWKNTLYTDEETMEAQSEENTDDGACEIAQTVGATSSMLSGHAVWQLIRWQQNEYSVQEHHRQIAGVAPLNGYSDAFS